MWLQKALCRLSEVQVFLLQTYLELSALFTQVLLHTKDLLLLSEGVLKPPSLAGMRFVEELGENWGVKGEISTLKPTSPSVLKASAPCIPASIGQACRTCLEAPKNTNPASGYLECGSPGSRWTYPDHLHHTQSQQQGAEHRPAVDFCRIRGETDSSPAPRPHSIPCLAVCVRISPADPAQTPGPPRAAKILFLLQGLPYAGASLALSSTGASEGNNNTLKACSYSRESRAVQRRDQLL